MTDSPGDADGQRDATDPGPVAGQPTWHTSGHAPGFVAGPPTAGPPGWGYGPPSGYPPPGRSTRGLVVIAAVALAAVLGVGIAVGIALSGDSSDEAVPASTPASPSEVPSTTTAPLSAPPGKYSMKSIADACDLIDPKPLTKWSATPTAPVHREDPPSGGYGGGLTCDVRYTSTSPTDGVTTDEAGISVLAEFTSAGEPPEYDNFQNAGAAQGWSTGTIPGLGAHNYWRGLAVTDPAPAATYVVAVQDSNVSVQVQVAVHRAPGEPPLKLSDLSAIARSQTRTVLDRLKH